MNANQLKSKPQVFVLQMAIQALDAFCEKHGAKLDEMAVVSFVVAWCEGTTFQWTPGGQDFARIYAVDPQEHGGRVALVMNSVRYGYELNQELTDELNQLIKSFTHGRWN
jgi:hypothetical protein